MAKSKLILTAEAADAAVGRLQHSTSTVKKEDGKKEKKEKKEKKHKSLMGESKKEKKEKEKKEKKRQKTKHFLPATTSSELHVLTGQSISKKSAMADRAAAEAAGTG